MIITLSFFSLLIDEFGHEISLEINNPINFYELFQLFSTKKGLVAEKFFLEKDYNLKDEFNILLDGKNIEGMAGLRTIIENSGEISFFTKIGGG